MGYTLIKYDRTPEEVFKDVLESMGISKTHHEVKMAFSKTKQEFKSVHFDYLFGRIPSGEYWSKWNSTALKHLNLPHNAALGRQVQERWFDHLDWEIYPDVKEILENVKQTGLKIGLVTTAYEYEIDLILKKVGVQKQSFDVVVGADTVKEVKPHPHVFKYALEKLNVKPEETLFIGDSVEIDYTPSEDVGMKAVLIKREGSDCKIQNMRIIRNLREISRFMIQGDKSENRVCTA